MPWTFRVPSARSPRQSSARSRCGRCRASTSSTGMAGPCARARPSILSSLPASPSMDLASPATVTPAPAFADDPSGATRPSVIVIERLRQSPAETLATLTMDSDAQGVRFVRRLIDEWASGVNRFEQPGEVLFCAHRAGAVVGVCGLNVDPYVGAGGERRVGRVRHLYVVSTHRRLGIGDRLLG